MTVTDAASFGRPDELNHEKLVLLRDLLNDVVAARMLNDSTQADGAAWFGQLRLCQQGLRAGETTIGWNEVAIDANESNGRVTVRGLGQVLGKTSMIENNVVPGLLAIEKLRSPEV